MECRVYKTNLGKPPGRVFGGVWGADAPHGIRINLSFGRAGPVLIQLSGQACGSPANIVPSYLDTLMPDTFVGHGAKIS